MCQSAGGMVVGAWVYIAHVDPFCWHQPPAREKHPRADRVYKARADAVYAAAFASATRAPVE